MKKAAKRKRWGQERKREGERGRRKRTVAAYTLFLWTWHKRIKPDSTKDKRDTLELIWHKTVRLRPSSPFLVFLSFIFSVVLVLLGLSPLLCLQLLLLLLLLLAYLLPVRLSACCLIWFPCCPRTLLRYHGVVIGIRQQRETCLHLIISLGCVAFNNGFGLAVLWPYIKENKHRHPIANKHMLPCFVSYKKTPLYEITARPERTRRADWRESTLARRLCFVKSFAARSWATSASTSKRDPLKERERRLSNSSNFSVCLSASALCATHSSACACYPWICAFDTPTPLSNQPTNSNPVMTPPTTTTLPNKKQKKRENRKKNKKMEGGRRTNEEAQQNKFHYTDILCWLRGGEKWRLSERERKAIDRYDFLKKSPKALSSPLSTPFSLRFFLRLNCTPNHNPNPTNQPPLCTLVFFRIAYFAYKANKIRSQNPLFSLVSMELCMCVCVAYLLMMIMMMLPSFFASVTTLFEPP